MNERVYEQNFYLRVQSYMCSNSEHASHCPCRRDRDRKTRSNGDQQPRDLRRKLAGGYLRADG